MKTIIIGERACGETTFIKNVIIPSANGNFLVVDFNAEYTEYANNNIQLIHPLDITKIKNQLTEIIKSTDDNTLIILDDFKQFLSPTMDDNYKMSYKWLNDIMKNKKVVLSVKAILSGDSQGYNSLISDFDDIEKIYFIYSSSRNDEGKIDLFISENKNIMIEKIERSSLVVKYWNKN
jgi:6-pyruvoyl-tetrahydropterin synthase